MYIPGYVERGLALLILGLDVAARLDENLGQLPAAHGGGDVQSSVTVLQTKVESLVKRS